jgi:hypothetical protein
MFQGLLPRKTPMRYKNCILALVEYLIRPFVLLTIGVEFVCVSLEI